MAYLFWLFFGAHYLYFRRPGTQLLFWLTAGGFGIWALIDLFRIPGMVDEQNLELLDATDRPSRRTSEPEQAPSSSPFTVLGTAIIIVAVILFLSRNESAVLAWLNAKAPGKFIQAPAVPAPADAIAPMPTSAPAVSTPGHRASVLAAPPLAPDPAPAPPVNRPLVWRQGPSGDWLQIEQGTSMMQALGGGGGGSFQQPRQPTQSTSEKEIRSAWGWDQRSKSLDR